MEYGHSSTRQVAEAMGTRYVLGSLPRDTRTVHGKAYRVVKLLFYQYGDMEMEEGKCEGRN